MLYECFCDLDIILWDTKLSIFSQLKCKYIISILAIIFVLIACSKRSPVRSPTFFWPFWTRRHFFKVWKFAKKWQSVLQSFTMTDCHSHNLPTQQDAMDNIKIALSDCTFIQASDNSTTNSLQGCHEVYTIVGKCADIQIYNSTYIGQCKALNNNNFVSC